MKRMHLHISVADLPASVAFYSTLFGSGPTVEKPDYAKWMLEDPRVNFAISARGQAPGLDHLGIQVDSEAELAESHARLAAAELQMVTQTGTVCCYAESNKHWVQDPSGIAWENYHTLASAPTFNDSTQLQTTACCTPQMQAVTLSFKKKSG